MENTYIGPEQDAYNTYSGAHTGSGRKGRVRFPDGKIRTVTLGVPDTFFSIPAHGRIDGRYVSGFVSIADWRDEEEHGIPEGTYLFTPTGRYATA